MRAPQRRSDRRDAIERDQPIGLHGLREGRCALRFYRHNGHVRPTHRVQSCGDAAQQAASADGEHNRTRLDPRFGDLTHEAGMSAPHLWIIKGMNVDCAGLLGQRHGVSIGIIPRRAVDQQLSSGALNQFA